MSIGFQNPISGSTGSFNLFVKSQTSPGGAIRGYMPQTILKTDKDYVEFEQIRFTLKQSWNTTYPSQLKRAHKQRIITPFRAVNNSGDILSRKDYSCGGSCQTFQSRPGLKGLSTHFGSIHSICDGTGIPPASCNGKYVYDSSDYITYLKQNAINKNYNALSYGGNDFNGAQSVFRAIRRY
jgi:hypothetical protein